MRGDGRQAKLAPSLGGKRATVVVVFEKQNRRPENPSLTQVVAHPRLDVAEVFANDDKKAISVLREFNQHCSDSELSPERFKAIMNQIKSGLGVKGKDLFHPVRIALIGSHSGPDFDRLIPLIEEGSRLELPIKLKSVHERIIEVLAALEHRRG